MKEYALTPAVFYILLAIGTEELHGYEIMKKVNLLSNEKIKLGPGTLYGSIKRMLAANLIVEVEKKQTSARKRRYYRLTEPGKSHLAKELERYFQVVEAVRQENLLIKLLPRIPF